MPTTAAILLRCSKIRSTVNWALDPFVSFAPGSQAHNDRRHDMLYQIYETQRALMAPFSEFASATSKLYNHPLSPFAHIPMAERVAAGFDLIHRLAKEYEKPPFNITTATVGGVEVAVQGQGADAPPFCRPLRFQRLTDNVGALTRLKNHPTPPGGAPPAGPPPTLLRGTPQGAPPGPQELILSLLTLPQPTRTT